MPVIDNVLERVQSEAGDQSDIILDYVRKRFGKKVLPTDPKSVRKLILHLQQRGFDEHHIMGALKGIIPAAALQPFETGD
jgi:SOS response regulatory protein OraA/RecX